MKISQAIATLDELKNNVFSSDQKIQWINELEWRIKREIIDVHEGADGITFDGYQGNESMEKLLIAPAPWDMVYVRWMEAMIDYHNGESARFANSRILFNDMYADFAAWYHRTHRPLNVQMKYY